MTAFTIFWKVATKDIIVGKTNGNTPEGYTVLGSFEHDGLSDPLGTKDNHVIWHHVRDALYTIGVQDMAFVTTLFYPKGYGESGGGGGGDPIVCAYPLDATLAEIQAINPLAGKPVMSNGDQTGTMTITGGLGTYKSLFTFPTAIPSGYKTVSFDSGVKVFEFDYEMPDFSGATVAESSICDVFIQLVDATISEVINVEVLSSVEAELTQRTALRISNSTGVVAGGGFDILLPRAGRIAIRMDSATRTFEVETAAGVVELSDNTYSTSGDCIAYLALGENPGAPAEHAGKTMSASLVTDLAQMLYPLPDGATDICGNAL